MWCVVVFFFCMCVFDGIYVGGLCGCCVWLADVWCVVIVSVCLCYCWLYMFVLCVVCVLYIVNLLCFCCVVVSVGVCVVSLWC